jgi:hypothetical protein
MDKFRVGQKVRIIKCKEPEHQYLIGMTCTITSPSFADWRDETYRRYETDLMAEGKMVQPKEECIEPVYDGDEKSSWSECAWNPNKVKA